MTADQPPLTVKKVNEKKNMGLDKILGKLLKVAAFVVGPLLTKIFQQSIATGVYPAEWVLASQHATCTSLSLSSILNLQILNLVDSE